MVESLVRAIFAYPSDLAEEGIERSLTRMRDDLLLNAVAVNASYHHGRFLHPRRQGGKVRAVSEAAVSFLPSADVYGDLRPHVHADVAHEHVLEQVRAACDALNMNFFVWLVGLHNSTLGTEHPDSCTENAFGDKYTFNLCPSQPRSRAYLTNLVCDVSHQLQPSRLILETAGFLPWRHGMHHEMVLPNLGDLAEALLSLCFCPSCLDKAAAQGVDGESVRELVKSLLAHLLETERGMIPPELARGDLALILVEYPELYAYVQMRLDSVATLLEAVKEALDPRTKLELIPSVFYVPSTLGWLEGVSFRRAAAVADILLPLPYAKESAAVPCDIQVISGLCPGTPFDVGFNVGSAFTPSAANLKEKAVLASEGGAQGLFYYNYGTLNNTRLGWIRQANQALLQGV